jgi:hypothetical protein
VIFTLDHIRRRVQPDHPSHGPYLLGGQETINTLLQIASKRVIIGADCAIIRQVLQAPFVYLRGLVDDFQTSGDG